MGQTDAMEEMREMGRIFSSTGGLLGGEGIAGIAGMYVKDDRP